MFVYIALPLFTLRYLCLHCVTSVYIALPLFTLRYLCDIHTALQTYFINKVCL